jgi:hypothetical protein
MMRAERQSEGDRPIAFAGRLDNTEKQAVTGTHTCDDGEQTESVAPAEHGPEHVELGLPPDPKRPARQFEHDEEPELDHRPGIHRRHAYM